MDWELRTEQRADRLQIAASCRELSADSRDQCAEREQRQLQRQRRQTADELQTTTMVSGVCSTLLETDVLYSEHSQQSLSSLSAIRTQNSKNRSLNSSLKSER